MKVRFGLCAFLVVLAGCSNQDSTSTLSLQQSQAQAKGTRTGTPVVSGRSPAMSIASAPDRGALIDYSNKRSAPHRQGAYTFHPIALSEEHALRAAVTGQMSVPTPDGERVRLRYERHVEDADGNWTWIGRVIGGDQKQEAIITFGEKAVFGSIPQPNGQPPLRLSTRRGSLFAITTNAALVPNIHEGVTDVLVPPATVSTAATAAAAAQAAPVQVAQTAAAAASPATTVDLAVGYTSGFATALGGQSQAATRVSFLVQVSNQAYQNSQINGAVRLVRAIQVNYADNTSNKSALEQLTGKNSNGGNVTVPAGLAPLRAARDEYGADIAVLLRDFQTPESEGCGIAWLLGANQQNITSADAAYGYSVVSDGTDQGTDGKTYFCADETLVHELGHLMGSAHDRDNSENDEGELLFGRYPYSFGQKTDSSTGNFFTIMAYGDNGQNFYRAFSNPLILRCGPANNLACGVANQTDNARSLNQTIPLVAQFRARIVPVTGNAPRDFDGDGRSDVFWRNFSSGQNVVWPGGNRQSSSFVATVSDLNWNAVASGDFNGDGMSDVFWRNKVSGENIIWPSGSSNELRSAQTIPDAGWMIVGAGDFNGDGKTDLFWRHSTNGQNVIWWAAESNNTRAELTISGSWRVVGVGDFNGDGADDLFWRNLSTGENVVWPSGSISRSYAQTTISNQAWGVAAVGDFNADGNSDVFWMNASTGETVLWPSGGYAGSSFEAVVAANWRVASSGDFNADGRVDLFWHNVATGASIVWWSAKPANSVAMDPVFTTWAPVL